MLPTSSISYEIIHTFSYISVARILRLIIVQPMVDLYVLIANRMNKCCNAFFSTRKNFYSLKIDSQFNKQNHMSEKLNNKHPVVKPHKSQLPIWDYKASKRK